MRLAITQPIFINAHDIFLFSSFSLSCGHLMLYFLCDTEKLEHVNQLEKAFPALMDRDQMTPYGVTELSRHWWLFVMACHSRGAMPLPASLVTFIINESNGNELKWIWNQDIVIFIHKNAPEKGVWKCWTFCFYLDRMAGIQIPQEWHATQAPVFV